MKNKLVVLLTLAVLCMAFCSGCGNVDEPAAVLENPDPASQVQPPAETVAGTEAAQTEAVKDKKQAILVVSFGTSYNDSRDLTIGAIENTIAAAFPQYEVRRAFTSQIIIDKLAERDGLLIDNVGEALDRAVADGITTLVVQPTHLMDGYEYTDLAEELADYEAQFETVVLGAPLLADDADFDAVADAIAAHTADYDDGQTAICFMGHGTEADANSVYPKLQETLSEKGYDNYYIGTVEAEPSLDDVLAAVGANGDYTKVVLEPLMVVAGDHATNDMAGDGDDSWKSCFTAAGYEVTCLLEGLGQNDDICRLYVSHTQDAVDSITE